MAPFHNSKPGSLIVSGAGFPFLWNLFSASIRLRFTIVLLYVFANEPLFAQNFTARGTFDQTSYALDGSVYQARQYVFSVSVVSNTYQIEYMLKNDKLVPKTSLDGAMKVTHLISGCDGTNLYNILVQPNSYITQVFPKDTISDQDPVGAVIWWAYCSKAAFGREDATRILGDEFNAWFFWIGLSASHISVETETSSDASARTSTVRFLAPNYTFRNLQPGPSVKENLPNAYANGWECLRLETVATTNFAGQILPQTFEYRRFGPKTNAVSRNDLNLLERGLFSLTAIQQATSIPSLFEKDKETVVTVFDRRFSKKRDDVPLDYTLTNELFLPADSPLIRELTNARGSTFRRAPVQGSRRDLIFSLLALLCLGATGLILVSKRPKSPNQGMRPKD